ncbi:hypothetical protein DRQ53_07455 [bacterium]|nr:MAG: hypothetical protein DRQ53_07455 [bacterium]
MAICTVSGWMRDRGHALNRIARDRRVVVGGVWTVGVVGVDPLSLPKILGFGCDWIDGSGQFVGCLLSRVDD